MTLIIITILLAASAILLRQIWLEIRQAWAVEPRQPVRLMARDEEYEEAIRREARWFEENPDEWPGR